MSELELDKVKELRTGQRIGDNLTVLRKLTGRSEDPVIMAWDHAAWCPVVCKMFGSKRRAHREATALSSFRHPNIVRCLGVREPAYVLMEYLDGPSLTDIIHERPDGWLSVSDAIRVTIHIGAALAHIHGNGFLHLDVKPDNIKVVHGRPMLFDFGSLRSQDAPRTPQIHGTDPYIAPEEWLLQETGPATDVFSLGVTLYEMLTGKLPFSQARKGTPAGQISSAPKPPRLHRPRLSRRLEELILLCLAREPAKRPALQTLLPALHGEIRSGPPMWPLALQKTQGWRLRHAS